MSRQIRRLMCSICILSVFCFGLASAQEQQIGTAEAILMDAEQYAKLYKVSLLEAVRRLKLQKVIGDLNSQLLKGYPESFAGLWIEHQPEYKVMIRLVQKAAPGKLLGSLPAAIPDLKIEILGADYSLTQLETVVKQASTVSRRAGVEGEFDIDVRANRAVMLTLDSAELDGRFNKGSLGLPEALEVRQVPELSTQTVLLGGLPMSTCTMGFSVEEPATGNRGVLTAGHCESFQASTGSGSVLPFQSECFFGSHEVQWHSDLPHAPAVPSVRSGNGVRLITGTVGRSQQAVGSVVCKHGMTTGYSCGEIVTTSFLPRFPPNANPMYVAVHAKAKGGDSGSPAYAGSDAWGIVVGRLRLSAYFDFFVYMPIDFIDCLNVEVLLYSPPPPPSCEDDCEQALGDCEEDFCYWEYDEYMCNIGCELDYDDCLDDC